MDCRPPGWNHDSVHGYPSYAVSIALQVDGVLEAGCIFDAVGGVPYTAVRGGGAYRDGEPIAVSETPVLDRALLVTGFPYDRRTQIDRYLPYVREFFIASQGFDGRAPRPWTSPPSPPGGSTGTGSSGSIPGMSPQESLLVQEAGGMVSGHGGGTLDLMRPRLLATNGKIHDEMTQKLAELLRSG